ncbi:MAG: PFL_4695 family integrating conjugative element protein, partial [Gammaproteobacteria bacterium]
AGGEPIGPYLARLAPRASHGHQPQQPPAAQSGRAYPLAHHLPIRSPSLSPGTVEARHHPTRLLQPLFLVGTDPRSLAWLEANRERLEQMGAIGMLVQADNEAELKQAIAAAQGLPLIPASGEAFATALGIRHYPVLITREGFEP